MAKTLLHLLGRVQLQKNCTIEKKTSRNFDTLSGSSSDTQYSRKPNQYSTEWEKCVSLAGDLIKGNKPTSSLENQCYHLSAGSSYPSNSVASTRVQIPSGTGNKLFDYQTTL